MLHITNGDVTAGVLAEAVMAGEILPWRDVLHEGPVPAGLSLERMSETRARFIADCGWQTWDKAYADFQVRDAKLAAFRDHEEVILWFEHDLYDQLQLLQVLEWLSQQAPGDTRLSLIGAGDYLGTMKAEQLAALYPHRVPVRAEHLELGRRAWAAFCSPDPTKWQRLAAIDTSVLPFLRAALLRHLEQYPALTNGINRTERALLKAAQAGISNAGKIFKAAQEQEESRFMGDSLFWIYLKTMAHSRPPLLRVSNGASFRLPEACESPAEFRGQNILITDAGEKVLANELDWITINGIDKWLGGVHLTRENLWRWDRDKQWLSRTKL